MKKRVRKKLFNRFSMGSGWAGDIMLHFQGIKRAHGRGYMPGMLRITMIIDDEEFSPSKITRGPRVVVVGKRWFRRMLREQEET